jgi:hypothetical protein
MNDLRGSVGFAVKNDVITRCGPPLSRYQILVRELRALEHQIRSGKAGTFALARRKEKLRRRLEQEREAL